MVEKILYFDVETTGIDDKECEIVQIAGIIEIDGLVKEKFNLLMKPTQNARIEEQALEVIGKTKEEIFSYPPQQIVYTKFKRILETYVNKYDKQDKLKLVGHNISFDFNFLLAWSRRMDDKFIGSLVSYKEQFCTFRVIQAMKFLGLVEKTEDDKLTTLCKYFGIELDNAHDALFDIEATRELYLKIKGIIAKR